MTPIWIHHSKTKKFLSYNPSDLKLIRFLVWAPPFSLAATWGIRILFLFLQLLECFTSLGMLSDHLCAGMTEVYSDGFPHSEIPGSRVATHLPEAYRRYATSFIAVLCLGIHREPLWASFKRGFGEIGRLNVQIRNPKTLFVIILGTSSHTNRM